MEAVLANWGRRSGQPMSDDQRKAMFARMGGGGGGGGGGSSSGGNDLAAQYERMRAAGIDVYDADHAPSWWDKTKAFFSGAVEGARGGAYGVSNAAPVAIMLYNKTLDQYANLFPEVGYGSDFPPPMATNGLDIMLWASNEYSVAMSRVAWTTAPTSVRNVVILYIDKE